MVDPNSYSFGAENEDDDDEELEDLVAKQERPPIDFASILKGETDDNQGSEPRSIGEIFGISKAEDNQDSEPSTFDKIIGRTLEETDEQASDEVAVEEETTTQEESVDSEQAEVPELSSSDELAPDDTAEITDESEEELTPAKAISSETVYADSHEYPLVEEAAADSEPTAGASDDSEKESAAQPDQESGRTDKISSEEEPATAPEIKQTPEAVPDQAAAESPSAETAEPEPEPQFQPIEAEPASAPEIPEPPQDSVESAAEPEPQAFQPEEVEAEPEPAPESAPEPEIEPEIEQEPAKPAEQLDAPKQPEAAAEEAETPEEIDRHVRELMGENEGSEDRDEPPNLTRSAASEQPLEPVKDIEQNLPDAEQKAQSAAGPLALLLGIREIFKRRKGDRENRQALEEQETRQEQDHQELKARQERADKEIDQLKRVEDLPDDLPETDSQTAESEELESDDQPKFETIAEHQQLEKAEIALSEDSETVWPPRPETANLENSDFPDYESELAQNQGFDVGDTTESAYDQPESRFTPPNFNQSPSEESLVREVDHEIEEFEHQIDQELELEKAETAEQTRELNQEIDGELALDSRHESAASDKIPTDPAPEQTGFEQKTTHISEVIAGSQHANLEEAKSRPTETNDQKVALQNQELRSSIIAGATVGAIIAVLAAIFLIFK